MTHRNDSWSEFVAGFGPRVWSFGFPGGPRGRRRQMFESGEMKYIILRLIKEKPRHGYEIIKALEESMSGCYTPSAGTIYPTLQLLEDQGFVRAVEEEGKRVYHITPDGEKFLEEHRSTVDDILDRVKDAVRGFAGGSMVELNAAFGALARDAYGKAWRAGPDDERTKKITEILKRAAAEVAAA
ncbi:MAG: PadR family transcriptional regulator [Gemmatimonadales bacterium]